MGFNSGFKGLIETELAVEVVSNYEMSKKKTTRRKSCSCKEKSGG